MAHRSPARWLAPLALLMCALAVLAVVASGSGGSDKDDSTTNGATTSAVASKKRTTTTATTTTARRTTTTPRSYTVKAGDTPSGIAESLGVTVQELLAANPGVDAQTLRVGQSLKLPR